MDLNPSLDICHEPHRAHCQPFIRLGEVGPQRELSDPLARYAETVRDLLRPVQTARHAARLAIAGLCKRGVYARELHA